MKNITVNIENMYILFIKLQDEINNDVVTKRNIYYKYIKKLNKILKILEYLKNIVLNNNDNNLNILQKLHLKSIIKLSSKIINNDAVKSSYTSIELYDNVMVDKSNAKDINIKITVNYNNVGHVVNKILEKSIYED